MSIVRQKRGINGKSSTQISSIVLQIYLPVITQFRPILFNNFRVLFDSRVVPREEKRQRYFQASFNNIFRYEINLLTRLNTNFRLSHKNFLLLIWIHSVSSKKDVKDVKNSLQIFLSLYSIQSL